VKSKGEYPQTYLHAMNLSLQKYTYNRNRMRANNYHPTVIHECE